MINYSDLFKRLKGKSLGSTMSQGEADKLMPWAYQFANKENGRPYHDDWRAPFLPSWLQPWGKIRRMDTTFRIPLPFKMIRGNMKPRWMAWQEGYPEAPGAEFRPVQEGTPAWDLKTRFGKPIEREVLAYDPVGGPAEWGDFAAPIDGEWIECFHTETRMLWGRRLHMNHIFKPDMTWGDFQGNLPDASLTWTKIK